MSRKLMLLSAGALCALTFAIFTAGASAGEFTADCSAGSTCAATVKSTTGEGKPPIQLENTSGEKIACTSVSGTASLTSGTSTGTTRLLFHGCQEQVTIFKFACTNTATSGTITTNTLTSHLIYIDEAKAMPGVLLTGVNVTFSCAGFSNKTVTGNIIGWIQNPICKSPATGHTVSFEGFLPGNQKYDQVTSTGTIFDLTSNNDAGGAYRTSSQSGTAHVTYSSGTVTLTC